MTRSFMRFSTRLKSPQANQTDHANGDGNDDILLVRNENPDNKDENDSAIAQSSLPVVPSLEQAPQHSLHTMHSTRSIRSPLGTLIQKIGKSLSTVLFGKVEPLVPPERKVRGGVLLYGCATVREHWEKHDMLVDGLSELKGCEGLLAAGLESRLVPCDKHRGIEEEEKKDGMIYAAENPYSNQSETTAISQSDDLHLFCEECRTKLFHIATNTPVTAENRKQFIADGCMYDEISRCCQEIAHDRMIFAGDLEWIDIGHVDENNEAICALVSKDFKEHPTKPTLLIVTGKGKVRAGIFSRQHILTTGLEPSCAIYQVIEARKRGWTVVVLDPNARGERMAMITLEQSMASLFSFIERRDPAPCEMPLYIQAHSASGSYVVRYLMDKGQFYLNQIRGVVFTDSTHNIQWCRTQNQPDLHTFLESPKCMYFRSSNPARDFDWRKHTAGEACNSFDEYWERRFGKIQTYWAGTTEHSLSDWHARHFIWRHFDSRSEDYENFENE